MLVRLYEQNPNGKAIDKIIGILKEGGIIIYPTDTVYAMGCDALNVRAIEKICKLKGINPQKNHLSIICPDLSNISEYARVNNTVFKLMKRNLPGPFTFILNATNSLPKIYKNRKEVGIRVPDNNITLTLAKELGNPLLTTSVRDKEGEYIVDPELIEEDYDDVANVIIDGGYGGLEPSTIVNCTADEIEIVRQGKGVLIE